MSDRQENVLQLVEVWGDVWRLWIHTIDGDPSTQEVMDLTTQAMAHLRRAIVESCPEDVA